MCGMHAHNPGMVALRKQKFKSGRGGVVGVQSLVVGERELFRARH